MKNTYVIIGIVVVLILGLGFLARHKIKTMLMGAPAPTTSTMITAPTSSPEAMMKQASQAATINNDVVRTSTDPKKGNYLTDLQGMTLYTYDKDTTNKSVCTGACLAKWPAYSTNEEANDLPENVATFKRADGTTQYSWMGKPLYYYAPDKKAGEILGDGVGGVWHIVTP